MTETARVRTTVRDLWLVRYDGTNAEDVTRELGTDEWQDGVDGHAPTPGNWFYVDVDGLVGCMGELAKQTHTEPYPPAK